MIKGDKTKPEIYIAGIARNNPLSFRIKSKITKPIYKATILIIILLIASLSTLVFSRTSFWTTNLVNLSIDSDFTLFVDVTNNRIGINTSDPTATLQVNGSVRVVPLASCNTIDTDANGLMSCGVDDAGVASAVINSSEYVFINDTFPKAVNLSNVLFVNGSSGRVGIGIRTQLDKLHIADGLLRIEGNRSDRLSLNVSNVLFVNASSSRVGIGAPPSNTVLQVKNIDDTGGIIRVGSDASDTTPTRRVTFGDGTSLVYVGETVGTDDELELNGRVGIRFETTSSFTQMFISQTGNVGINTTSPTSTLQVQGTLNVSGGQGASALYVADTGNVGIGTSSPGSARLNVSGNISVSGATTGIIFSDGTFQTTATTAPNIGTIDKNSITQAELTSGYMNISGASVILTTGANRVLVTATGYTSSGNTGNPTVTIGFKINSTGVYSTPKDLLFTQHCNDGCGATVTTYDMFAISYITNVTSAGSNNFTLVAKASINHAVTGVTLYHFGVQELK